MNILFLLALLMSFGACYSGGCGSGRTDSKSVIIQDKLEPRSHEFKYVVKGAQNVEGE